MNTMKHLIRHLILGFWSAIVLFPLWVMLVNSLKQRLDIYKNPFSLPPVWDFSSYVGIFRDSSFLRYFQNSIIITIASIFLLLIVGSIAAYAIASWNHKASRIFYYIFIAGMLLPIRIASIDLLSLVQKLGLLNRLSSLLPIYIAMGIPIAIFILTEFIRGIPSELIEAAYMDGATPFRIYTRIIVPLIRPALGSVAIFNLVPYWNDLWFPLLFITREESKTVILGVTRLFGQYQTDWSRVLSVLSLSVVPVLLLYLFMSRQFIRGLTAGAVKG